MSYESFVGFATEQGLLIDEIKIGEVGRCGTMEKPRSKNGSYRYNPEADAGWVKNWGRSEAVFYYRGGDYNADIKIVRKEDLTQANRDAVVSAGLVLNSCVISTHQYLIDKRLDKKVNITETGSLIIPMFSFKDYSLVGYQRIYEENGRWVKKMCSGMKAKGAVHILGDRRANGFILCEGYATGLSILRATKLGGLKMSVIVCFSAGNMVHVAEIIPKNRRNQCFVYADNDKSGVGVDSAVKTGLKWVQSDVEGNDANDDHQQFGLTYVLNKLCSII